MFWLELQSTAKAVDQFIQHHQCTSVLPDGLDKFTSRMYRRSDIVTIVNIVWQKHVTWLLMLALTNLQSSIFLLNIAYILVQV